MMSMMGDGRMSEAGRVVGLVQPASGAWPVRPGPQGQEDKR
jgi:hypothetical protein